MSTIDFKTVPHILCEQKVSARIGSILKEKYHVQSIMLISDEGIQSVGILDIVTQSLVSSGLRVVTFTGVLADPSEEVVLNALALAKNNKIELVIGLGGGSSMDVAKLVAVLHASQQTLQDIYGVDNVQGARATPLVLMPTTAGTGSEVTPIAIITTGETTKMGVVASQLYADMAVLDAALTVGLPKHVTAATGIDAMVHAIEAYTSKHKKNILSDGLAKQALNLLANNLLLVIDDGKNIQAREAMLLGSMLAGQAFANSPVAAVHALAYPLGGIFHVPHGLSNSLVLPYILRFNSTHCAKEYAELAPLLVDNCVGSNQQKAEQFIQAIETLIDKVALPKTLREVGVTENDIARLAEDAMLQARLLVNNPREVTLQDAIAIYESAF